MFPALLRTPLVLGLVALLAACAEPFGRPPEPDPAEVSAASTPPDVESGPRAAADLGAAADSSKPRPPAPDDKAPSKTGDEDEGGEDWELNEETTGDLLFLDGETPSVRQGARVTLTCIGKKSGEEGSEESSCKSTLRVLTKKGKKESVLAETAEAPEIKNFKADGGDRQTTLKLDLFPLLKKPRASLIRVIEDTHGGESISTSSALTETLYLLRAGKLVEVLSYATSSAESVDTDPPHGVDTKSEATLSIDKKTTRGLPDLVLRESTSETRAGRTRRSKSTTRYIWDGQRYDACAPKLDSVQHCGACGHACKKGEGCCGQRCMPLDTAQHCGACEVSCKATGHGDAPRCAEPAKKRCDIACVSDHYDVDGDAKNGCEEQLAPAGHHSETAALDRGAKSCSDGASADEVTGVMLSDQRVHEGAELGEWNPRTGAAPTYVRVRAAGGLLCENDLRASLRIAGGAATKPCYRLTVRTDRGQRSVDVASGSEAVIEAGRGAYSNGSTVLFKIHKLCRLPQQESVQFTLRYHL